MCLDTICSLYDDVEGAGAGDHANTYMIHAAMPLNRKKIGQAFSVFRLV